MSEGGWRMGEKPRERRSGRIDWEDSNHIDRAMTTTKSWITTVSRSLFPAALITVLATCATNPVTGRRELSLISESQEIQMGQEGAKAVVASISPVPDNALQQYVSNLGMTLARASERPNLPWTFQVID